MTVVMLGGGETKGYGHIRLLLFDRAGAVATEYHGINGIPPNASAHATETVFDFTGHPVVFRSTPCYSVATNSRSFALLRMTEEWRSG